MRLSPTDVMRSDDTFFAPCAVCGISPSARHAVIQSGMCPGACDHMKRVQQRLRRIRRDYSTDQMEA